MPNEKITMTPFVKDSEAEEQVDQNVSIKNGTESAPYAPKTADKASEFFASQISKGPSKPNRLKNETAPVIVKGPTAEEVAEEAKGMMVSMHDTGPNTLTPTAEAVPVAPAEVTQENTSMFASLKNKAKDIWESLGRKKRQATLITTFGVATMVNAQHGPNATPPEKVGDPSKPNTAMARKVSVAPTQAEGYSKFTENGKTFYIKTIPGAEKAGAIAKQVHHTATGTKKASTLTGKPAPKSIQVLIEILQKK